MSGPNPPPLSEIERKRRLLRAQLERETRATLHSWRKLGNFCRDAYWTRDPKRKKILAFPKPEQRPDLYAMAEVLDSFKLTVGDKSRQVMESNLHLAEPVRDVLVDANTVWIIKSLSEAHSKELVFDRIAHSLDAIPREVRLRYRIVPTISENRIDILTCDGLPWNSTIFAAPDSVAWVRQRTPSGLLLDEFGSMLDAEEVYSVALAMVQPEQDEETGEIVQGKMRMLSTAVPDSQHQAMMGSSFDEAREICIASGWAALKAA